MYPPLCGGGWCGVSFKPPRGVPIPPRPRQDRRDSAVSAAMWGWVVWCLLESPSRRPYPPAAPVGPNGFRCIRRCVGMGSVVSRRNPAGVPIPPQPRQVRRDSGVSARCVGVGCVVSPKNPQGAFVSPRGRTRTGRDSSIAAAVWGWVVWFLLKTPPGRPYPPAAQAGPEGLGCTRRCVGVGGGLSLQNPQGASLSPRGRGKIRGTRVYPVLCGGGWCGGSSKPPRGVPILPRPRQVRRDSGISTAVWGWLVWCLLKTPTGHFYPPRPR